MGGKKVVHTNELWNIKLRVDLFEVSLLCDIPSFTENGDNILYLLKTESRFWLPAANRDYKQYLCWIFTSDR